MPSKYLGTFGNFDFFIAQSNGEYKDEEAVRSLQKARYNLMTEGKTKSGKPINIFCTAINLDHETKREISYFDDLDTTYHIFAIDKNNKELVGGCSYAFESEEKFNGVRIGLPMENKINNGYPRGFDLDEFREKYEYNGRRTSPEERMELFRHFKLPRYFGNILPNIGMYKGGFQEFVKERVKKGKKPKTKWLFCSIPPYYNKIYRPLSSMMIPLIINNIDMDDCSPSIENMEKNEEGYFYKGIKVTYKFPLIISRKKGEEKSELWADFIPQIIDIDRGNDIIREDKYFRKHKELNPIACRIIVEDLFENNHKGVHDKFLNYLAKRLARAYPYYGWE